MTRMSHALTLTDSNVTASAQLVGLVEFYVVPHPIVYRVTSCVPTSFEVILKNVFFGRAESAQHTDEGETPRFGTHAAVSQTYCWSSTLCPPRFTVVRNNVVHLS